MENSIQNQEINLSLLLQNPIKFIETNLCSELKIILIESDKQKSLHTKQILEQLDKKIPNIIQQFSNPELAKYIPTIEHISSYAELQKFNGKLVKCRYMIQSQFDPEIYVPQALNLQNYKNNTDIENFSSILANFRFKEDISEEALQNQQNFDIENEGIMKERLSCYCIPIQGENKWVQQQSLLTQSEQQLKQQEQQNENQEEENFEIQVSAKENFSVKSSDHISKYFNTLKQKKIFNQAANNHKFPCIVKFDDEKQQSNLKLNDIIEVIGIFYIQKPTSTNKLAEQAEYQKQQQQKQNQYQEQNQCQEQTIQTEKSILKEEEQKNNQKQQQNELEILDEFSQTVDYCYPPSLVPRIHCLSFTSIPFKQYDELILKNIPQTMNENFQILEQQLLNVFNQIFNNDTLVSYYSIFALFSKTNFKFKEEVQMIDKLILNIFNSNQFKFQYEQKQIQIPELFSIIIEKLLPKSTCIKLNIQSLENKKLRPVKNFSNNQLELGELQLTQNTVLIIDETTMNTGILKEEGLKNLQALNNLLQFQQIQFDFIYQQSNIESNIPAIVFSQGKTFLKTDVNICLEKNEQQQQEIILPLPPQLCDLFLKEDYQNEANSDEALLNKFRRYILEVRQKQSEMQISKEVNEFINEDYLKIRKQQNAEKNNANKIEVSDLCNWMNVAKILSALKGQNEITKEIYEQARDLEFSRTKRVLIQTSNNTNNQSNSEQKQK